ncbi:uncharacterized protein G2W53_015199 [Senna tora]|uniref:Uncharacterized protein n=1 Tax=Senna tora TaxID=362788 RepID=A0A834WUT9_9FABA|nr:uncharacterized protein G2W53_015199 [Senna tora]
MASFTVLVPQTGINSEEVA